MTGLPALFLTVGQSTDTCGNTLSPVRWNSRALLLEVGVNLKRKQKQKQASAWPSVLQLFQQDNHDGPVSSVSVRPGALLQRGLKHGVVELHHLGCEGDRGKRVGLAGNGHR